MYSSDIKMFGIYVHKVDVLVCHASKMSTEHMQKPVFLKKAILVLLRCGAETK